MAAQRKTCYRHSNLFAYLLGGREEWINIRREGKVRKKGKVRKEVREKDRETGLTRISCIKLKKRQ